ncbi:MAG: glycine cleavage T C-terminal barrel domain-containing protein [Planctomycetota bacterium]|nr:glycine cleavage T C-terminal barrel domain-containing protein [Planctomycetota bacterium]
MKIISTPLERTFREWGADFLEMDHIRLPLRVTGAGPEYEAARTTTMIADGGDRAWIEMRGYDLVDFLQRILSSDVSKLEPGTGQWSAILDGKGHWIADLLLYRLEAADGQVRIGIDMPTECYNHMVERIELLHFAEDLEYLTPEPARLLLLGPGSKESIQAIGLDMDSDYEFASKRFENCTVLRRPDRGVDCLELVGSEDVIVDLATNLKDNGAVPGGWVALDILRVEAGRPRWGSDFDEHVTLPASNEWHRASITKGCYAGQEVVAKINTYGESPRQLCRLHFDGEPRPLVGAEIHDAEGHKMGRVTSWVWSPQENRAIGLGMLRRRIAVDGVEVDAIDPQDGTSVKATVAVPEKVFG